MDDIATDMAKRECSNNKYYVSAFRYIYIYIEFDLSPVHF